MVVGVEMLGLNKLTVGLAALPPPVSRNIWLAGASLGRNPELSAGQDVPTTR